MRICSFYSLPYTYSHLSDEGDFVYQPFEPELDWSSFSVALPESEVPTMHVELGAMSAQPGRLDAMRLVRRRGVRMSITVGASNSARGYMGRQRQRAWES